MRRERIGQTQHGGQLGSEQRRTQDVQRDVGALARDGMDAGDGARVAEQALQLHHVGGEVLGRHGVASQGVGGALIAARGPPETQIDPPGMQRGQGAELLGDHER